MKDLRKKANLPVKGHLITAAGYQVNETTVKEMLTLMGVNNDDPAIVQEAIGYMSANGMEVNMNNLYEFLKSKKIMSKCVDNRLKKN
jgi:hypothetical protein